MPAVTIEVEIDTFWNVKSGDQFYLDEHDGGRNRYILECKGLQGAQVRNEKLVEIDTFWNVKTSNYKEKRNAIE